MKVKVIYLIIAFSLGCVCPIFIIKHRDNSKKEMINTAINGFVERITRGSFNPNKEVDNLNWVILESFTLQTHKELMVGLIRKLRNIDLSNVPYKSRSSIMWRIYMTQSEINNKFLPPNASDEEVWRCRLDVLSWYKNQIDRVCEASIEEPNFGESQKVGQCQWDKYTEHKKWKLCCRQITSSFQSILKRYVQDAEREHYSEEFRTWCFKEIEKIIGRPLTDDDIMFKEDVLRRRAERKKQTEEWINRKTSNKDAK